MAVEDAVRALRDHREDVLARLGQEQRQRLRDLVGKLGGPGHVRAVHEIADLCVEWLPRDHPVRRALVQGYLFQAATINWAQFSADFAVGGADPDAAGSDAGASVLAEVAARLLRAPALTTDELRRRGADPADPDLIRLDRPDGGTQWPGFQFAHGGGPLPVVRAVNRVLDAAHDPVGAADWWLSRNVWLDGQPSTLIGAVPDDYLVRAARALSAEV